jgi:hypothetical protein
VQWPWGKDDRTQLTRIERKVDQLMASNAEMKAILDNILTQVAAESTKVDDLIARLQAGGVDPALIAEAQQISDNLAAIKPEPAAG